LALLIHAPQLELSESSVKRLFASGNFSLKRLQTICDLIGMEFFDLVEIAENRRRNIEQLSEEQEKTLVAAFWPWELALFEPYRRSDHG